MRAVSMRPRHGGMAQSPPKDRGWRCFAQRAITSLMPRCVREGVKLFGMADDVYAPNVRYAVDPQNRNGE